MTEAVAWLLIVHAAATFTMFGVILVVQVVHYPLFGDVGAAGFVRYQRRHMRRITYVVLPAMTVELVTAVLLVALRPPAVPGWIAWTGLALVGVIWASTALWQVPLHQHLQHGFDDAAHRRLVATNGVRTLAWTLRAVLVVLMLVPLLRR